MKKLGEAEIRETIAQLPPEVRLALEKDVLGASKFAMEIVKALKAKGWSIGEYEDAKFPEDRGFSPASDVDVAKIIDMELEKHA